MSYTPEAPPPRTWQCGTCNKAAWHHKATAKHEAKRLGAKYGRRFRLYRCPDDEQPPGWHLTTEGRRGKTRLHAHEAGTPT